MAHVYVDRYGTGFQVTVFKGMLEKSSVYHQTRDEALSFAINHTGRAGIVVDTTEMTGDQLSAHMEREDRLSRKVSRGSQF